MTAKRKNKEEKKCLVIGIAGGSGSGKTTFAKRLIKESRKMGLKACMFSLDNYYKPLDDRPFEERKKYNFDHPDAIDSDLAAQQLEDLCKGKAIQQPAYDFKRHTREEKTTKITPKDLIIVEGLYTLYFKKISSLCDYKVFVSTGMVTSTLRRVERDIKERGRTVEDIKKQILATVLPMYETHVKPTMRYAHFIVNWEGEEIPDKATVGFVRMLRDHFSAKSALKPSPDKNKKCKNKTDAEERPENK